MSKNYFFSFIKNDLIYTQKFKNFKLKISAQHQNQEILVYELFSDLGAIVAKIGEVQLTLVEHHITFFEMIKKDKPNQYHYTATLKDQAGKKYSLHVYFDKRDKFTVAPSLTQDVEEPKTVYPELESTLGELAIGQISQIIAELRCLYQKKINQIQEEYTTLEGRLTAMSTTLADNLVPYLALLDETITCIMHMCRYEDFKSLLTIFYRIKHSLTTPSSTKNFAIFSESEDEAEDSVQAQVGETSQAKPMVKKNIVTVALLEAQAHYEAYLSQKNQLDQNKTVEVFVLLHDKVHEALLLTDDKEIARKKADLIKIQTLLAFTNLEGGKLLEKFLSSNTFELAGKLKKFTPMICASMLKMALVQDNYKLLDFLFSNDDIAINTTAVEGIPLVLYCFLKHTPKTPKVDCLSVLIKHGASIMMQHEGLPLCFYILENDNGLRKAIIDNSNAVLNLDFYNCLIQNLQNYLLMQPTDSIKAALVEKALVKYKTKMSSTSSFQSIRSMLDPRVKQKLETAGANIASHIDRQSLEEVRNDPEVRQLLIRFGEAVKDYLATLPVIKKKTLINRAAELMDNIHRLHTTKPVRVDKDETITYYKCVIRMLELKVALHAVQLKLKQKPGRRICKKLEAELKSISLELNDLQEQYEGVMSLMNQAGCHLDVTAIVKEIDCKVAQIQQCQEVLKEIPEVVEFLASDRNKGMRDMINNWQASKAKLGGRQLVNEEEMAEFVSFRDGLNSIAQTMCVLAENMGFFVAVMEAEDSDLNEVVAGGQAVRFP